MVKKYINNTLINYLILITVLLSVFLFFFNVDISLWYHQNQPVYFHNQTFGTLFREPGEPVVLLSAYVGQYMGNNVTGALLLTLMIAIWIFSLTLFFKELAQKQHFILLLVFSAIPFLIANSYYNYPISITVSYVLTALTAALTLPYINNIKIYYTIILFSFLTAVIYILCGIPGIMIFIVLTASLFLLNKKYSNLFLLIIPLITPFLYTLFFNDISIQEAYWGMFIPQKYLFIPLPIKLIPICLCVLVLVASKLPVQRTSSWFYSVLIDFALLIIILGLVYKLSFNEAQKTRVLVDKLAYEKEWTELLKTAKKIDLTSSRMSQFQVNRALYHKGELLSKMFNYPQYFGEDGLFLESRTTGSIAIQESDLFYDMSFCNGSRYWANEAFTVFGPQPGILKRLASCYIATNQFELAKKYLSLLELSVKNRDWAISMRKYIDCENCVKESNEFSSLLKYKEFTDSFIVLNNPRATLDFLYSEKYKNRMALEYMLASDLLNHNLEDFIGNVGKLKNCGYAKLPAPLQEAVLIYVGKSKNYNIDIKGYTIDQQVREDFISFNKIISSVRGDKGRAKPLLGEYKNTYMYYANYNSPIAQGRKDKLKTADSN